jgi:hypothetical protein
MRTELSEIIVRIHKKQTASLLGIADISFMLHTSRRCDVLFVFVRGFSGPLYIIKLSRDAENKTRLANEAGALISLELIAPEHLQGTFPMALYEGEVHGHYLVVENFLGGTALNERLYACRKSKKELNRIFSLITDWQIALHASSACSPESVSAFLEGGFWLECLEKYKSANPQGLPGEYANQIAALLDTSKGLAECFIRPVLGHNDLSPYNIFYDTGRDKISVIDWATASNKAAPLLGLLNFFTVSQSVLRGFEETKNAKIYFSFSRNIHSVMPDDRDLLQLFYQPSWINELIREHINRYIRALNLDKRLLSLFFLLFILRHMNHSPGALELCMQKEKELRI